MLLIPVPPEVTLFPSASPLREGVVMTGPRRARLTCAAATLVAAVALPLVAPSGVLAGSPAATAAPDGTGPSTTTTTTPLPSEPSALLVDEGRGRVLIAVPGTGTLVATDLAGTVLLERTGLSSASDLAFSPDGSQVHVALPAEDAIATLRADDLREVQRTSTGL